MKINGGILVIVSELIRADRYKRHIREYGEFTATVDEDRFQPKDLNLCLLSLSGGCITHLALGERSPKKVVTGYYRIKFTRIYEIKRVPFSCILMNFKIRKNTEKRLFESDGGYLKNGLWENFIEAIIKCSPMETETIFHELEKILLGNIPKIRNEKASYTKNEEQDAVGLCLTLAGGSPARRMLETETIQGVSERPFIQDLMNVEIHEEDILRHDLKFFGLLEREDKDYLQGAATFLMGNKRLSVMNVNRKKLEKTFGVDLIYYNELHHAYLMVQYKRMQKYGEDDWKYYPSADHSFEDELSRMRLVSKNLIDLKRPKTNQEFYRLNPGFLYFKFCRPSHFIPHPKELVKGMYAPFELVDSFTRTMPSGKKKHAAISWDTLPKHLNNTLFINLVCGGWIGSTKEITEDIRKIIKNSISKGNSLFMAHENQA